MDSKLLEKIEIFPTPPVLFSFHTVCFFCYSRYLVSHRASSGAVSASCLLFAACSTGHASRPLQICSKIFPFPLCSELSLPKPDTVFVVYCSCFQFAYIVLLACYLCLSANFLIFFFLFFEICRETLTKVEELLLILDALGEPNSISNLPPSSD